jgi:hypothetical protein
MHNLSEAFFPLDVSASALADNGRFYCNIYRVISARIGVTNVTRPLFVAQQQINTVDITVKSLIG